MLTFFTTRPILGSVVIAGAIAILGLFPLLGIPGALIHTVWSFFFKIFRMDFVVPELVGDKAWPTAILVSIVWPWFLPLTFWLASYANLQSWSEVWPWLIPSYLVWSLVSCVGLSRVVN